MCSHKTHTQRPHTRAFEYLLDVCAHVCTDANTQHTHAGLHTLYTCAQRMCPPTTVEGDADTPTAPPTHAHQHNPQAPPHSHTTAPTQSSTHEHTSTPSHSYTHSGLCSTPYTQPMGWQVTVSGRVTSQRSPQRRSLTATSLEPPHLLR